MADEQEPAEGAPVFFAREIIDESLLRGSVYRIHPIVDVRDFEYVFRLESDFGNFEEVGVENLKKRVHEIEVTSALQRVTQSQAFTASLSSSISDPVATTVGVARRPVSAVVGLPGGIARYLGGKFYQIKKGSGAAMERYRQFRNGESDEEETEEAEEGGKSSRIAQKANSLSKRHLGYDAAKRKWAKRFGVDPYSDNVALQDALGRIAWASSFGSFAGDFAMPASEVVSYAGKAQEIVWDKPPHQLERDISLKLRGLGVSKDLIQEFIDFGGYSLTEKTQLCLVFQQLGECEGVTSLMKFVLQAESLRDAEVMLRTVAMIGHYNATVSRVATIGFRNGMVVLSSENGYETLPIAVDYLHWTPLVYEALLSDSFAGTEKKELWVAGEVSPVAKIRLRHHGWAVFEKKEP